MPTDQREVLRDYVVRKLGRVTDDQFDAIFTGAQMLARKENPVTDQDLRDMVSAHVTIYSSRPGYRGWRN